MQLPKPTALIFDWDGTIVDTLPLVNEGMNHVRALYGKPPHTLEQTRADSVHRGEVIFRRDFGNDGEKVRSQFLDYFRANHLNRFGTPAERATDATDRNTSMMPGAVELLDWLATQPIPCGVLTHRLRDTMAPEIPYLGYQNLFKVVVCSGEGPAGKPEPEAAWHVLELLGVPASPTVWLVGDTHGDVTCALAAGLTPVLVQAQPYDHASQPALQLPDCLALLDLLKRLY